MEVGLRGGGSIGGGGGGGIGQGQPRVHVYWELPLFPPHFFLILLCICFVFFLQFCIGNSALYISVLIPFFLKASLSSLTLGARPSCITVQVQ